MDYRLIKREELEKFREIDRSEIVEHIYYFRNGTLKLEEEFYDLKGWGASHLESCVQKLYDIYDTKGFIYGAFDGDKLGGAVALENKFIGSNKDYMKLDKLYVSTEYRGKGVGRLLMDIAKAKARELGAKKLYISATPSENTVKFYMGIGCRLTEEIIKELFEQEPEDIHMELALD